MIEWVLIEAFFEAWRNTFLAFFSFSTFSYSVYRVTASLVKKRTAEEQRLCKQDSDIKALNDRVDQLSKLCEEQIQTNGEAYALAREVKGKLDR